MSTPHSRSSQHPSWSVPLDTIFNDPFQDPLPFSLTPSAPPHPQSQPHPQPQPQTQPHPQPHHTSAHTQQQQSQLHPPQLQQQNLPPPPPPPPPSHPHPPTHPQPPPYPQQPTQPLRPPLPLTNLDSLSPAHRRKLRIELRRARLRARRALAPPRPPHERQSSTIQLSPVVRQDPRPSAALDKKAARVIRNREVALKARQAAKTKMKNLEEENSTLKNRATTLEVENSTLKSQIEMLRKNNPPLSSNPASGSGAGGGVPWEGDIGLGGAGVVNAMTH